MMLWFIRNFWRSLVTAGTLIGILYIPADIQGLPEALRPIQDAIAMIEREWLLNVFSLLLVGWII